MFLSLIPNCSPFRMRLNLFLAQLFKNVYEASLAPQALKLGVHAGFLA